MKRSWWFALFIPVFLFGASSLPTNLQIVALATSYDSLDTDLTTYAATFPINSFVSTDLPILGNFCVNSSDSSTDPLLANDLTTRFFYTYHTGSWFVKTGSVIVDIGAMSGSYAYGLSGTDPTITAYAFEHDLNYFTQLLVNQFIQNPSNVTYKRIGLSNTTGWVNPGSGYPNKHGIVFPTRAPGLVKITTLDSFNLENVSFLKINASGSELDVLQGAQATIEASLPTVLILFSGGELDYPNTDSGTKSYIDSCISFLEALEYRTVYLYGSSFLFLSTQSQFP